METLASLEARARELAAQIASAKAVEKAEEDKKLVVIPLEGADGEIHLHEVSAGAARALLKNSTIAKAVNAQTEDAGAKKPESGNKPKRFGRVRKILTRRVI